MTATQQEQDKDAVAQVGFMAIMTLMFGGVGVVLAAIAVGVDRAWQNRFGAGGSAGERATPADHRAWLAYDAERRRRYRRAYRSWLLDPNRTEDARPAQPGAGTRFGWWLRRMYARTVLGARDFREGVTDGWAAANKVRRDGGTFRDIVTAPVAARTYKCPTCRDTGVVASGRCPNCNPSPAAKSQQVQPVAAPTAAPTVAAAPPAPPSAPAQTGMPNQADTGQAAPIEPAAQQAPQTSGPATGQQSTEPTQGASMSGTGITITPFGETHADHTLAKLDGIGGSIRQAEDLNDQAAACATAIDAQVAAASEYADQKGASTATRQALDEARAVANTIKAKVAELADLCARANDSLGAATAGMRTAVDAQDSLHASGARGDIVATATSD